MFTIGKNDGEFFLSTNLPFGASPQTSIRNGVDTSDSGCSSPSSSYVPNLPIPVINGNNVNRNFSSAPPGAVAPAMLPQCYYSDIGGHPLNQPRSMELSSVHTAQPVHPSLHDRGVGSGDNEIVYTHLGHSACNEGSYRWTWNDMPNNWKYNNCCMFPNYPLTYPPPYMHHPYPYHPVNKFQTYYNERSRHKAFLSGPHWAEYSTRNRLFEQNNSVRSASNQIEITPVSVSQGLCTCNSCFAFPSFYGPKEDQRYQQQNSTPTPVYGRQQSIRSQNENDASTESTQIDNNKLMVSLPGGSLLFSVPFTALSSTCSGMSKTSNPKTPHRRKRPYNRKTRNDVIRYVFPPEKMNDVDATIDGNFPDTNREPSLPSPKKHNDSEHNNVNSALTSIIRGDENSVNNHNSGSGSKITKRIKLPSGNQNEPVSPNTPSTFQSTSCTPRKINPVVPIERKSPMGTSATTQEQATTCQLKNGAKKSKGNCELKVSDTFNATGDKQEFCNMPNIFDIMGESETVKTYTDIDQQHAETCNDTDPQETLTNDEEKDSVKLGDNVGQQSKNSVPITHGSTSMFENDPSGKDIHCNSYFPCFLSEDSDSDSELESSKISKSKIGVDDKNATGVNEIEKIRMPESDKQNQSSDEDESHIRNAMISASPKSPFSHKNQISESSLIKDTKMVFQISSQFPLLDSLELWQEEEKKALSSKTGNDHFSRSYSLLSPDEETDGAFLKFNDSYPMDLSCARNDNTETTLESNYKTGATHIGHQENEPCFNSIQPPSFPSHTGFAVSIPQDKFIKRLESNDTVRKSDLENLHVHTVTDDLTVTSHPLTKDKVYQHDIYQEDKPNNTLTLSLTSHETFRSENVITISSGLSDLSRRNVKSGNEIGLKSFSVHVISEDKTPKPLENEYSNKERYNNDGGKYMQPQRDYNEIINRVVKRTAHRTEISIGRTPKFLRILHTDDFQGTSNSTTRRRRTSSVTKALLGSSKNNNNRKIGLNKTKTKLNGDLNKVFVLGKTPRTQLSGREKLKEVLLEVPGPMERRTRPRMPVSRNDVSVTELQTACNIKNYAQGNNGMPQLSECPENVRWRKSVSQKEKKIFASRTQKNYRSSRCKQGKGTSPEIFHTLNIPDHVENSESMHNTQTKPANISIGIGIDGLIQTQHKISVINMSKSSKPEHNEHNVLDSSSSNISATVTAGANSTNQSDRVANLQSQIETGFNNIDDDDDDILDLHPERDSFLDSLV